jgi:hypothetical protein
MHYSLTLIITFMKALILNPDVLIQTTGAPPSATSELGGVLQSRL